MQRSESDNPGAYKSSKQKLVFEFKGEEDPFELAN